MTFDVPYYVRDEALEIGRTVYDSLDPHHTPLVVVRIEPALIVVKPDGELTSVLAHLVEVEED